MREISLLKQLAGMPYFVKMLDVIKDEDHPDRTISTIFEYCPLSLANFFSKRKQTIPV
jgi:serine/threonine protein kinase